MGFLDRVAGFGKSFGSDLYGIGSGVAGVADNVVGIPVDLGQAVFSEDEYEGFRGTLMGIAVDRGSGVLENAFGPDEGFGAAIRTLPRGFRQPLGHGINYILDGAEYVGEEYLREPLATAMLAASISDSPENLDGGNRHVQGFLNLFNADIWREANAMAEDISFGQSIILAISTRDILDDTEVANTMNTDMFNMASGSIDLAFRIFREPDYLIGKSVRAVKRSRVLGAQPLRVAARTPLIGSVRITRSGQTIDDAIAGVFHSLDAQGKSRRALIFGDTKISLPSEQPRLLRQEAAGYRVEARRLAKEGGNDAEVIRLRELANKKFTPTPRITRAEKKARPSLEDSPNEAAKTIQAHEDSFMDMVDDVAGTTGESFTSFDLTRRFKIPSSVADEIMDVLEETGVIAERTGSAARPSVVRSKDRWSDDLSEVLESRRFAGLDDPVRGGVGAPANDPFLGGVGDNAIPNVADATPGNPYNPLSRSEYNMGQGLPGRNETTNAYYESLDVADKAFADVAMLKRAHQIATETGKPIGLTEMAQVQGLDMNIVREVEALDRLRGLVGGAMVPTGGRHMYAFDDTLDWNEIIEQVTKRAEETHGVIRPRKLTDIGTKPKGTTSVTPGGEPLGSPYNIEPKNQWDQGIGRPRAENNSYLSDLSETDQAFAEIAILKRSVDIAKEVDGMVSMNTVARAQGLSEGGKGALDILRKIKRLAGDGFVELDRNSFAARGDFDFDELYEKLIRAAEKQHGATRPDKLDRLIKGTLPSGSSTVPSASAVKNGVDNAGQGVDDLIEAVEVVPDPKLGPPSPKKPQRSIDPDTQSKHVESFNQKIGEDVRTNISLSERRRQLFLSFGSPRFREIDNRIQFLKDMVNPDGSRAMTNNEIASLINQQMMKRHELGDRLSSMLATAENAQQRELVWRVAMGDLSANKEMLNLNRALEADLLGMISERSTIVEKIDDAGALRDEMNRQSGKNAIGEPLEPGVVDLSDMDFSSVQSNMNKLQGTKDRMAARLDGVESALIRSDKEISLFRMFELKDVRNRPIQNYIKATTAYQDSKFGQVVRTFIERSPHHTLTMADPNAADLYMRVLRRMGFTDKQAANLHGEFLGMTFDQRTGAYFKAERIALDRMGKFYNLTETQILDIKLAAKRGHDEFRELATGVEKAVRFDGAGNAIVAAADDSGEMIEAALMTSQLQHTVAVVNWKEVNRRMRDAARSSYYRDFEDYYQSLKRGATSLGGKNADPFDIGPLSDEVTKLDLLRDTHKNISLRKQADTALSRADDKLLNDLSPYKGSSVGPVTAARRTAAEALHVTETGQYTLDKMEMIMQAWKPTVLLRPAWAVRVVLMDETFRMAAKFGTMEAMLGRGNDFQNLFAEMLDIHPKLKQFLKTENKFKLGAAGAVAGAATGGPVGALIGAAGGAGGSKMLNMLGNVEKAGFPALSINGYRAAAAFGEGGDNLGRYAEQVSSGRSINEFVRTGEKNLMESLRPSGQSWKSHSWDEAGTVAADRANQEYVVEWVEAMQKQALNDEMAKKFLEGQTRDEVVQWLNQTKEGINHADRLPLWGRNAESRTKWVDALAEQIDSYTGRNQQVRDRLMALGPESTFDDYATVLDNIPISERATIHGREFEQVVGKPNSMPAWIGNTIDSAYKTFAAAPTDNLSRMPAFRRFYEAELNRTLGTIPASTLDEGSIAVSQLQGYEEHARRFALKETKELMYDLAENTEFGELTRLIMPFFPAFQEVLTRWAGLVYDNPNIAFLADEIWNAPSRMGIAYEDENGEEFIQIRIPDFAKGLLSHSLFGDNLTEQSTVRFKKDSFNMVAQGTPGFGPWATIPVSIAARANPSLEEALDFIIPFGPVGPGFGGVIEAFKAPTIARLNSTRKKENDAAFVNAQNRIMQSKLVDAARGLRPPIDYDDPIQRDAFMKEVRDEAFAFSALRIVAGLISPVTPNFDSPYKLHIDMYRAIRNRDWSNAEEIGKTLNPQTAGQLEALYNESGESADAVFLTVFGEEYFALTQGFTQTLDGVPPTLEGMAGRERYKDLVERFPEWGGVIVGNEGGEAVKFSRSSYDRQLNTELTAGSDQNQRERLSPLDIMQNPDIELGWERFSRAMEQLDVIRLERGLANFQLKGAADLAEVKRVIVNQLREDYPAWWREYNTVDRLKMPDRLDGARAILAQGDQALLNRPDIRGLQDYMELRARFRQALVERGELGGSSTLTSQANLDLAEAWETARLQIVEANLPFADIYYRRFIRDDLSVE